jgi:hypothetical protein
MRVTVNSPRPIVRRDLLPTERNVLDALLRMSDDELAHVEPGLFLGLPARLLAEVLANTAEILEEGGDATTDSAIVIANPHVNYLPLIAGQR